jgi:catechol 2,3-dioxygenase-like lactoylglutathione lyase family enzyme
VFARVAIRASDLEASTRFYETVLSTLAAGWGEFAVVQADAEVTRRLHVGFVAASRAEVDEFWRVGTAAGYRDDGEPGPRPQYLEDYYGAFLLDPDGNSAEAVHHGSLRRDGSVDHIWMRVTDLAKSTDFYEGVAQLADFRLAAASAERSRFAGRGGSLTLLSGAPTEHAELGFHGDPTSMIDPDGNRVEVSRG